ncbi:hypothetical protein CH375_23030 [Leptospira ellisii]|nr:hypothetical protein CH375_23030 [Leptospira ellisii]
MFFSCPHQTKCPSKVSKRKKIAFEKPNTFLFEEQFRLKLEEFCSKRLGTISNNSCFTQEIIQRYIQKCEMKSINLKEASDSKRKFDNQRYFRLSEFCGFVRKYNNSNHTIVMKICENGIIFKG